MARPPSGCRISAARSRYGVASVPSRNEHRIQTFTPERIFIQDLLSRLYVPWERCQQIRCGWVCRAKLVTSSLRARYEFCGLRHVKRMTALLAHSRDYAAGIDRDRFVYCGLCGRGCVTGVECSRSSAAGAVRVSIGCRRRGAGLFASGRRSGSRRIHRDEIHRVSVLVLWVWFFTVNTPANLRVGYETRPRHQQYPYGSIKSCVMYFVAFCGVLLYDRWCISRRDCVLARGGKNRCKRVYRVGSSGRRALSMALNTWSKCAIIPHMKWHKTSVLIVSASETILRDDRSVPRYKRQLQLRLASTMHNGRRCVKRLGLEVNGC